jgi:transcriptional antiterminator NusG
MSDASLQKTAAMPWYAVHVAAGFEKAAKKLLEERIAFSDLRERFGAEIFLPVEKVVELKSGRKSESERKFFPSYLFIQMEMTPETWHLVKNTPRVTGFIGGDAKNPRPIPEHEILELKKRVEAGEASPRPKVVFARGEQVRVKEGPFADFTGTVEDVNFDRSKLTVAVTIFGRATPVELDFDQVERG